MAKRKKPRIRNKPPPPKTSTAIGLLVATVLLSVFAYLLFYVNNLAEVDLSPEVRSFIPVVYFLPSATLLLGVYSLIKLIRFRRRGHLLEKKRKIQQPRSKRK